MALNYVRNSLRRYLKETGRPVYSAALVLPFFLIYHAGTFLFRASNINGADALIIRVLSNLSVHSVFASALVLLSCFIVWQLRTRASWKIDAANLIVMFIESLLFALLLFLLLAFLPVFYNLAASYGFSSGRMQKLVLYCGAGIYEELLFRLFLLGGLLLALTRILRIRRNAATVLAAVAASVLFALFHYMGPTADSFSAAGFLQRIAGGLYFSLLYIGRGFGVTASAHVFYDMLIGFASS